ncbi:MAG: bifunctional diguanylate cyclase/phosphodiesterase [Cyanobacteria bacterium P01_C01_bin.89]
MKGRSLGQGFLEASFNGWLVLTPVLEENGQLVDLVCTQANHQTTELLSCDLQDLIGCSLKEFCKRNKQFIGVFKLCINTVQSGEAKSYNWRYTYSGKQEVETRYLRTRACTTNEHVLVSIADWSDHVRLQRKIRHQQEQIQYHLEYDHLTGLLNRKGFISALETMVKKEERYTLGLLDLDYFRELNETLGHAAGDEMLTGVSYALNMAVEGVIIARISGDEFGILFPGDINDAQLQTEACLAFITSIRVSRKNVIFTGSASVGLVDLEDTRILEGSQLLVIANEAVRQAKLRGRNQVYIMPTSSPLLKEQRQEADWRRRIEVALEENELVLACQPIVPMPTDSDASPMVEVLMRLNDNGNIVSAGAFINAVARHPELMKRLDRWVVAEAIRLQAKYPKTCHAINLSGASLSDPSIVRFIADLLQETQAPPHQLHLEVTEQIALQAESGQSILKGLSELGCCIGLDDFGTGYSSFLYLQKFRPDFIKIDGSFMRHILTDPCSQAIVRAMLDMASTLEISAIAEFIETADIEYKLMSIKNEVAPDLKLYGQGWHYGGAEVQTILSADHLNPVEIPEQL